ncbi:hypothetical protein Q7P37_002138 [Cladosporium fusiforme]
MACFDFFVDSTAYYTKYEAKEALFHLTLRTLEDQCEHPESSPAETAATDNAFALPDPDGLLHLLDKISTKPTNFEIDSAIVVYPEWTSSCSGITVPDVYNEPRKTLIALLWPRLFLLGARIALVHGLLVALWTTSVTLPVCLQPHLVALQGWSPPATSLKYQLSRLLLPKNWSFGILQQIILVSLLNLTLESLASLSFPKWLVNCLVKALQPSVAGFCIWFVIDGWFRDVGYTPQEGRNQHVIRPDSRDAVASILSRGHIEEQETLIRMIQRGLRIERTLSEDGLFRLVLLWAIARGYKDLVGLVLDLNANVSTMNAVTDTERNFPLRLTSHEFDLALKACMKGADLGMMEHLLKCCASVATEAHWKSSALPFAASRPYLTSSMRYQMMEMLLDWGVDPDSHDSDSLTSLHYRVKHPQLVQLLLDKGARTEVRDRKGKTSLHHAFGFDPRMDSAERLLIAGADLEAYDNEGRTPLLYAIYESESADAVSWLIQHGADVDTCGTRNPLQTAAYWGQVDIARLLLDAGADPNFSNANSTVTPLSQAMGITRSTIKRSMVKLLLARGAEPTLQALAAAIRGDIELRSGFDTGITHYLIIEARNMGVPFTESTLNEAMSQKYRAHNFYVLTTMLDAGVDPNVRIHESSSGRTTGILNIACRESAIPLAEVTYIVAEGADVALPDSQGNTPLHEAAKSGSINAVSALVPAGASIQARNNKGQNALHLACGSFAQYNPVKILDFRRQLAPQFDDLRDLNERDRGGYAMSIDFERRLKREKQNHLSVIGRLLGESEESIHTQDNIGATAMHYACKSGDLDVLKLLMGAPRGRYILVDNRSCTPLHWAARYGRVEVVTAMTTQSPPASTIPGIDEVNKQLFGNLVRRTLPRCKDRWGRLPLHVAAEAGNSNCLDVLLERLDIDPDTPDEEGRTSLSFANHNNHLECRASLLTAISERAHTKEERGVSQDEVPHASPFLVVSGLVAVASALILLLANWW